MNLPPPEAYGLPHKEWRQPQVELLTQLTEESYRWTFVQGPPGCGKSAVIVAWLRQAGGGVILVKNHTQMAQYESVYGLPALRGRANFRCPRFGGQTAATAPCVDGFTCKLMDGGCAYYDQRAVAFASQIFVTTYAWLLAESRYRSLFRPTRIVCDEGHSLIDMFTTFDRIKVDGELASTMPGGWESVPYWAKQVVASLPAPPKADDLSPQAQKLRAKHRVLERLKALDTSRTLVRLPEKDGVSITPVWPTGSANKPFGSASRILVVSATLHPGGVLPEIMGVERGSWQQVEAGSVFKPELRPLVYWPQAKLSISSSKADYQRIAGAIAAIMRQWDSVKGLIHTSSIVQVEKIYDLLPGDVREAVVPHTGHRGSDREQLFQEFRQGVEPRWLMSPSAREGEDFPGDQCRAQVLAKVSFPDLGDPLIKLRAGDGPMGSAWYRAEACNGETQAYGRAMRAEDDWGWTYAVDGAMTYLLRGKVRLPSYVREALTYV